MALKKPLYLVMPSAPTLRMRFARRSERDACRSEHPTTNHRQRTQRVLGRMRDGSLPLHHETGAHNDHGHHDHFRHGASRAPEHQRMPPFSLIVCVAAAGAAHRTQGTLPPDHTELSALTWRSAASAVPSSSRRPARACNVDRPVRVVGAREVAWHAWRARARAAARGTPWTILVPGVLYY